MMHLQNYYLVKKVYFDHFCTCSSTEQISKTTNNTLRNIILSWPFKIIGTPEILCGYVVKLQSGKQKAQGSILADPDSFTLI